MSDQTEQVVEPVETEKPDDEVVKTGAETDAPDDGEEPEEEDIEEDLDGVKVRGKKDALERLKSERLMQADYTKKTQELAELRKDAEFQREAVQYRAQLQESFLSDVAEVRAIDKQLAAYQNVNWDALIDVDPVQAMKLERQARQLQSQREQAVGQLTQKQQQFEAARQHESAKLLGQGYAVLEREIPNWSNELAGKLKEFGKTRGYNDRTLLGTTDPAFVIDLYKQYKADQVRKASKPKTETQEKPVTSISSKKAGPTKDPEKMSTDEWLKWRNAQLRTR